MRWQTRIGIILIAILISVSIGYNFISKLPGVPACILGADPKLPGQTVCSAVLGGLWRSMGLGLFAGGIACMIAVFFAVLGRTLGGTADLVIEKTAESFFSIPDVLVLISLGYIARSISGGDSVSLSWMASGLVAIGWAAPTRMIQNRLRSLERQDFVHAAETVGATRWRIITRHLLPFAWDYLLAIFLLRVPSIVLTESTISYLGFGLPLNQPSLGKFLGEHWSYLVQGNGLQDWLIVLPAWFLLIALVLAFQWVGNGLLAKSEEASR